MANFFSCSLKSSKKFDFVNKLLSLIFNFHQSFKITLDIFFVNIPSLAMDIKVSKLFHCIDCENRGA
jgi:hypothetical protein